MGEDMAGLSGRHIKNLAVPHAAAAVQRDARIAQAEANRLATEAEPDRSRRPHVHAG
ncbi:hypothetical protein [Streptomyces sp. WAC06614]|uniref:hypothetical protein n=1 Tax=Streptomyces sp. WAC06614 TaxID=2487416 RepID=UPI00163D03A4|nr:hypothetical protein [Streptomyces sp. WAC06614]